MSKNLSSDLLAHYQGDTTLATCWKATLTNGTIVCATDHDGKLEVDGLVYLSTAGYTASDNASSSELNPDNLEVSGFLRSPAITDSDIKSGIWDFAAIEIFEVNWADTSMGKNILRTGTLGEVHGGTSKFTAELRGLLQAYSRVIVRLTTKDCTADLGDSRCKINLTSFTVTGSIFAVSSNRVLTDAARSSDPEDKYTKGKLTWLTGLNAGLSMEVKHSNGATVELAEPMAFMISASASNPLLRDTYSMSQGCQKRLVEDCKTTYSNVVNFRGFAYLPGSAAYKVGGQN